MRWPFTDKWNSFFHVAFGVAAVWIWWITPLFVAYQFMDPYEINLGIDLLEFATGYLFGFVIKLRHYII
jgi:hypothetical protein